MSGKMHLEKHVTYDVALEMLTCAICGATEELPMQGPVAEFKGKAFDFSETHKNCLP